MLVVKIILFIDIANKSTRKINMKCEENKKKKKMYKWIRYGICRMRKWMYDKLRAHTHNCTIWVVNKTRVPRIVWFSKKTKAKQIIIYKHLRRVTASVSSQLHTQTPNSNVFVYCTISYWTMNGSTTIETTVEIRFNYSISDSGIFHFSLVFLNYFISFLLFRLCFPVSSIHDWIDRTSHSVKLDAIE